jgi:hypothetical protein
MKRKETLCFTEHGRLHGDVHFKNTVFSCVIENKTETPTELSAIPTGSMPDKFHGEHQRNTRV